MIGLGPRYANILYQATLLPILDHSDREHARTGGGDQLSSVRDIYSAMQPFDAEEVRRALAHDIEWNLPDALPWGGAHHGHDGIRAISEIFHDHVEGTWSDPDEFFDVGDCIIVLGRMRGRARTSGREFEVPFAHVWGMRDGVPSWFRGYFDTAPITSALRSAGTATRVT